MSWATMECVADRRKTPDSGHPELKGSGLLESRVNRVTTQ